MKTAKIIYHGKIDKKCDGKCGVYYHSSYFYKVCIEDEQTLIMCIKCMREIYGELFTRSDIKFTRTNMSFLSINNILDHTQFIGNNFQTCNRCGFFCMGTLMHKLHFQNTSHTDILCDNCFDEKITIEYLRKDGYILKHHYILND